MTAAQELQLKTLRLAYRNATTDAERDLIKAKADAVKNPPPPEEVEEMTKNVTDTLMRLPDLSHPYWTGGRPRR